MSALKNLMISAVTLALTGCSWFSGDKAASRQIGAEAFYRPVPGAVDRRDMAPDHDGVIRDPYRVEEPTASPTPAPRPQVASGNPPAITSSADSAVVPPTTRPNDIVLPPPPQLAAGQFLMVGSLVCEVSGTPIYADKVVTYLAPDFVAKAKDLNPQEFRAYAMIEIRKRVKSMVQDELFYAAAVKNLTAEDRERAWNATYMWRDKQAQAAGGSIEMARLKAQQIGLNFDETVQDKYREYIVLVFRSKKLFPKVPVTADELRLYYETNLKTQFTETDQAQYRVIVVMASKISTTSDPNDRRTAAANKIKQIRESLVNGSDADFAKVASQTNDDAALMKNGGRVGDSDGWMPRSSYRVKAVEEAVWKLQPGQITDVVQVNDSYYIARLSDRKLGRTRSFEDPEVQAEIMDAIRRPQLAILQDKFIAELQQDAVVFPAEPRIEPVLDMVMQRYPAWAAAK